MSDLSHLDAKNPLLATARRDALIALAATGSVPVEKSTLQQFGEIARMFGPKVRWRILF
jgi:hypothetical protein